MSKCLFKNISWEAKICKFLTIVLLQMPFLWDISDLWSNTVHSKRFESSSLNIHFHFTVCIVEFDDCSCLIWIFSSSFAFRDWHTPICSLSHKRFSWKFLQANTNFLQFDCVFSCLLTQIEPVAWRLSHVFVNCFPMWNYALSPFMYYTKCI